MARTGVTYFDISQAAEAIKQRGEEPTVDRVRAELGTGSKSTIAPLLKRWRADTGESVADTGGLPADLVEALKALHRQVQQEAEGKIDAAQREFDATADRHDSEMAHLRNVLSERTASLEDLEQKLQNSTEENRNLQRDLQEMRAALAKSEVQREEGAGRVAELKSALEEARQENRDIRAHFEHFQQRTAEDRQQERDQHRLASEQLRHQAAGLSEQLAAAQRKIEQRESAIEQLRNDCAKLESEQQRQLEAASGHRAEIRALEQRCAEQQESLQQQTDLAGNLRETASALRASNAAFERESELQRDAAHRVQSALQTTEEKLGTISAENRQLLQEKAALQGRLQQLERASEDTRIE
ncbi:DNA-binding protein [Microbulbifer sp. SAOS-129_SWC]|uniref:DNA-binding protein n=1 Tax=Microbulbifer sp. SAOS-129_SWC TaxID=3145235 RepID=UPI0032170C89